MCCSGSDIFLGVLAVLFPPIAVWIKRGICTADSVINLALCCLGYLPGLLHAWYIITAYPEPDYAPLGQEADERTTVWYVTTSGGSQQPQPRPHGGRPTYGTMRAPGGGQFPGQVEGGAANYYAPAPAPGPGPAVSAGQGGSRGGVVAKKVAQPQQQPAPSPAHDLGNEESGEGPSDGAPPPSYNDVIQGDNKRQGP